ncbi:serine/threonine-protein kinase [Prosthecobacter sp.]|uniref:serine/threonine-protein kinase n=1 Tax=Prosthecobacter sp. TaxID=1965333 RepID=UPI002AB8A098|nr:serine/threonine-protein kinase [Prosthecobacter sp.]MDZ4403122.1 serine/threonine-protein kinase [Prosthecobacter sp.]
MSTDSRPASSHAGSQPGGGWTPPTVEQLQVLLPQYEIVSMLGHGGMGAVYKGRQKSLDRVVAIKILPPGLENSDAKFVERFQNEARTMAKLMHPGIVAVFDFGETAEGQLYFVMEYVDGTDVAKMIQSSGKLPQDYALAITAHVCDALAYAHGFGVVHRDIKPANILVNMQGQIKVADFGLAKADDPAQSSGLTKTGYAMGTPDYVSPEALIMGSSIDGRADLYAIGVMLYQMLTGEIPRGLFQMPNIRTKGETDPRFDAIISKAMQTDRESRYQTASELRRALDVILTTPHIKQDASQSVAAVPQQAVAETPGKRSAVAAKPAVKGPKPPQEAPPNQKAEIGKAKSNTGLWIGIAAAAVIVIGGVIFFTSGGKPKPVTASAPAAAPTTPKTPEPPKPKPAPPASTPAPKPAAGAQTNSAGWTDGLAEWVAVPGNVQGGIMKEEAGAWRIVKGESVRFGPKTPGRFLANVAVRITIRDMSNKNFAIHLRGQGSAKGGYQAGFGSSGRSDIFLEMPGAKRTALGNFQVPAGFVAGPRHVMEFRAEGDVLTTTLDGQTTGSVKDATFASGGISISGLGLLIEKIEYRDLGSAPAVTAVVSSSQAVDGGVWADALAEYFAKTTTDGRLVQEVGGARVMANGGTGFTGSRQFFTDMSLRVTARGGNEGHPPYWGALLSHGQGKGYGARINPKGTAELRLHMPTGGGSKELQSFKLPAGFDYAARHTLEFRAIGDELTFILDDVKLGSVRDSTLTGGRSPSFDGSVGGLIEKFEYKAMPKLSGSPAPADGGGPWSDAIAEWMANPGNASSGKLKTEGTGWRVEKGASIEISTNRPGRAMANVAVRTTWRDATALSINLRGQTTGDVYGATLWDSGAAKILVTADKKITEHPGAKPPAGFKAGESHALEFRAQGDVLTMLVDGQVTGSVKDATLTSGKCVVIPSSAWVEKIEYRELPVLSVAFPPSGSKESTATVLATPVVPPAAPPPAPSADPKLIALLQNYTKAITNGLSAAAPADKPAFEAELARLKNNAPLPDAAEDAKLPAELKRLRGILRGQLK